MTVPENTFDRVERSGFDLLMTDVDVALTLTKIAADAADNSEKRQRNQQNARHAYDTVLRLRRKMQLTPREDADLKDKIRELRTALENLGEVFDTAA
jgi:hypothetical protein